MSAEIVRVIAGRRPTDEAPAAALRWAPLDAETRVELTRRLALFPTLRAARPHPRDYASAVLSISTE